MRTSTRIASALLVMALSAPAAVAAQDSGSPETAQPPPVPSAGCGASEPGPIDHVAGSMMVGGVERSWVIAVPSAHDGTTPLPLVVMLHGLAGSSGEIRFITASGIHEDEGFVVVAPLGSGLISRWMWDLDDTAYDLSRSNPDVAFIEALIDRLGDELCLDLARVYATGHSNGAIGASVLGCVLADRLAAIAPVAALTDFGDACQEARAVPVLGIHGGADPYVLLEGGWGQGLDSFMLEDFVPFIDQPIAAWPGFQLGIPERAANIAGRNGCEPEPTLDTPVDGVTRTTWDCPTGADVELVVFDEAGHSWPTTPLEATALIWDFFSRHALTPAGAGAR